ncbi:MAG TPA: 4-(cytidine 5'-diphospho)-2-C-methyl-D-erythritol kinase [Candidatus Eisenbacteria bacterium]
MTAPRGAARGVRVEARAKLNLGLVVGPRRGDGDHEIATIYQSVSLADTLVVRSRRAGFVLRVRHENVAARGGRARPDATVPRGAGNLVLRAARLLARHAGLAGGARFDLVKRIPAGAGLGGGSADAAAALVALAALHRLRLRPRDRLELAASLGADVPFATRGGTALGLGRGERLRPLGLERPFRVLIAVPRWRVLTRRAFAEIDRNKYGLTGWSTKLRFAQSLGRKSLSPDAALTLGNSFESVLGRRRVDFASLRARLEGAGARGVRLTGSGSAVFGLLAPGANVARMLRSFVGSEALYLARSTRRAMRLRRF